jgi:hypoxanthine phosphoribosyltransferase
MNYINFKSIYEANSNNYNEIINSDIFLDYGIYKSGNKKYNKKIANIFFNFIINNLNINLDDEWIIITPNVNINKGQNLISYIGYELKNLMDHYYSHNFKIYHTYIDNDENAYDYMNITNFDTRYNVINKNIINFNDKINLENKNIILIDDSYIYGSTMKVTIDELKKYNLDIKKLYPIVYIKINDDILTDYPNIEYILNHQWFNIIYKKNFEKKFFCEYFINNYDDYFLTLKTLLCFLTINEEEIFYILNLLKNKNNIYKNIIRHFLIYNITEFSKYRNNFIIYKDNFILPDL